MKMVNKEAIVSIISQIGSPSKTRSVSKKTLQKIVYLIEAMGEDLGCKYGIHFYGPYSSNLEFAIYEMETKGELTIDYANPAYTIHVTKNTAPACGNETTRRVIQEFANETAGELELLTTVLYVYQRTHTTHPCSRDELNGKDSSDILEETRRVRGSRNTDADIQAAIDRLDRFGFFTVQTERGKTDMIEIIPKDNERRITVEQIRDGIAKGVVRFITDPNLESGTVCAIGDNWFYFGGETAENKSPEEYLKHVPIEDIIRDIMNTLEDFRLWERVEDAFDFGDEYNYYAAVLEEALGHKNTREKHANAQRQSQMSEEMAIEILKNYFPKKAKLVDGMYKGGFDDTESEFGQALLSAVSALEEVQQYRAIGSVRECQRAVGKMRRSPGGQGQEELLFTWDRICTMKKRQPKDLARQEVRKLMIRSGELASEDEETELPEDAIEEFCDRYEILFYGDGYIARANTDAMNQWNDYRNF